MPLFWGKPGIVRLWTDSVFMFCGALFGWTFHCCQWNLGVLGDDIVFDGFWQVVGYCLAADIMWLPGNIVTGWRLAA